MPDEDYTDLRDHLPRISTPPRLTDMLGRPVLMLPAGQMQLALLDLNDGEGLRLAIRLGASLSPTALEFLPTPDDMDALARELAKAADQARAQAAVLASELMQRSRKP